MHRMGAESASIPLDQKPAYAVLVSLAGSCPHESDVCKRTVRDPHLRAVENPGAIGVPNRARVHSARVAAVIVLRQPEAGDQLAALHTGQVALFLLVRSVGPNRVHA